jgi:hypothetical protein
MQGFVPHSAAPRAPGRRIIGSAFRLGGLALAVRPVPGSTRRTATIPRQRPGNLVGKDRRTDPV